MKFSRVDLKNVINYPVEFESVVSPTVLSDLVKQVDAYLGDEIIALWIVDDGVPVNFRQ